jgi:hypothetical protein
MISGATWTIADGGGSGKLWAGLHHDRKSARPHHSIGRARYCRRGGRITACQMSHMGQTRKSSWPTPTSGLPLKADIRRAGWHVRKVPISGIRRSDIIGSELTEYPVHTSFSVRKLSRKTKGDIFCLALTKRFDNQASTDLLIAPSKSLLGGHSNFV